MSCESTSRGWTSFAPCLLIAMAFGTGVACAEQGPSPTALSVEARIPLGDIKGRIDHLAIDVSRHRLYVAELGNDSVGVVDVQARKVIHALTRLREPQGIVYVPTTDTIYVANAGDGSVRIFDGADLNQRGQISLGSDADNVRVNHDGSRVFVGFGDGALAILDPKTQTKVAEIPLKAHPESFRIDNAGSRIFVNVPDAHAIAVIDLETKRQVANWTTGELRSNFPLALDASGHVLSVFRQPAKVGLFNVQDGHLLGSFDTCGDSDDVSVDAKRSRLYVICGEGFVDVYSQSDDQLRKISRVATQRGARTGLFVPEADRLYLAVRAGFGQPAAVWILKPT